MYIHFKRLFDIVFSLILLLCAFPIMIIVFILIILEDSKGSVIFKQNRIGKDNKYFSVYKFRTMITETHKNGRILYDNERMLKCGKYIRKYSLDELPQIFNVIKGEMSFIGPRPLPVKYFEYLTNEELLRHKVRPGISGLSQVSGRNYLSWDEKFKMDIKYIKDISFLLDARIFLLTLKNIFLKQEVGILGSDNVVKSLYEIRDKVER